MDHDAALVLAGGLIGLLSSVVALSLQRLWATRDRKHASDREALDMTVRALMAWETLALQMLAGGADPEVDARLRELDLHWEADPGLIPDRAAADELIARCRDAYMFRGERDAPTSIMESDRTMKLGDRVKLSARKRWHDLA